MKHESLRATNSGAKGRDAQVDMNHYGPVLTLEDVKALSGQQHESAVSIYLPTARGGAETSDAPIRLKNLITEAEKTLRARGVEKDAIEKQLAPARGLVEDTSFWRHQRDGLALFLSPDSMREFRVPMTFRELVMAGSAFHVTPLIAAVENGSEFFVVAVSRKDIRLLRGTRFTITELDLPELPKAKEDQFFSKNTAAQLQLHTQSGESGKDAVYHGQGGTERPQAERDLHVLRDVDRAVRRRISRSNAPLVFAGDVSLFALYRQANTSSNLLTEDFLHGNAETLSAEQLHRQAWELVSPRIEGERARAVQSVQQAVASNRGATRIATILRRAAQGHAEQVLVSDSERIWGRFRPDADQVQVLPGYEPDADELVNLAAAHTLRHGGRVSVVDTSELPGEAVAAAAFRF